MEIIWVLLTAAQVAAFRDQIRDEHLRNRPGHRLSVTWDVAHAQALVKIAARPAVVDALNLRAMPWWNKANHDEIFSWFYGPVWQTPEV